MNSGEGSHSACCRRVSKTHFPIDSQGIRWACGRTCPPYMNHYPTALVPMQRIHFASLLPLVKLANTIFDRLMIMIHRTPLRNTL